MEELANYPWSGHATVINRIKCDWQDREYVLHYFGKRERAARSAYLQFVLEQSSLGKQSELTGGGLVRSAGGWSEVLSLRQRGQKQFSDERILGSGEFVKEILDEVEETLKTLVPDTSSKVNAMEALAERCEVAGITSQALQSGSKRRECTQVRKELSRHFVLELGLSFADTARMLGISASAVNQILRRCSQS